MKPIAALMRLFFFAVLLAPAACAPGAPAGKLAPEQVRLRHLVLMLDGVPYPVMDSLRSAGHFAQFKQPSQVVSPFPSLTGPSFREVWGTGAAAGYEDRYYDAQKGKLTGGMLDHMFGVENASDFHKLIDFQPNGIQAGLAYLVPQTIAQSELRALRKTVAERVSKDSVLVGYIVSTDALGHRAGRAGLSRFLVELDDILRDMRARYGDQLEITLISDHGNDLVPTHRVDLDSTVRAAGFRPSDRITSADQVVLPAFGLVGASFIYAGASAEPRLADALRTTPGVDLVMFEDALARVHVCSRAGRAIVEQDHDRFRYTMEEGDPLELAPALARLQARGALDAQGFASDADWFRETPGGTYVDPLQRVVAAFGGQVRHPASLIVSFAPGYHFGDKTADWLVHVTGTHGSLRTTSSLAFYMSTNTTAPAIMRSRDLTRLLPRRTPPAPEVEAAGRAR